MYVSLASRALVFPSLCVSGSHSSSVLQRPHKASAEEMTKYHSDDYIKFLRSIRPDNMSEYSKQMQRCECGGLVRLVGCADSNTMTSFVSIVSLFLCSQCGRGLSGV